MTLLFGIKKKSMKCFAFPLVNVHRIVYEALWCNGSTLAFGSVGHGFESEHRLFSHHTASAFSKLRSLTKCCSLDDSVRRQM